MVSATIVGWAASWDGLHGGMGYMFGTGATVMGLCKLFGERRIAQLFGVAKPEKKQARLDFTELNSILSLFRLVNWMF